MQKITKFYSQTFNSPFGICVATVKMIIRQNKKEAFLQFLFGAKKVEDSTFRGSIPSHSVHTLEEMIQNLQNQVNSLQERVIHLENQNLENKRNINMLSASERSKQH